MEKLEINKQLAINLFEGMNNRDMILVQKIINENIIFDFPGIEQIEGDKKFIVFLKLLHRKYKTLKFTIIEMLFDHDKACLIWTNEGKYLDDSDYNNRGVTLFHFENDKISFLSDYFKNTSFK